MNHLPSRTSASIAVCPPRTRRIRLTAPQQEQALPAAGARTRLDCILMRAIDVSVAVVLLTICALPMLLLAALIKISSPGPVLFRQARVGLGGKCFTMLKFRTMRVDAEAKTGPVWARRGDPRCTRFGKLMRRLSLDELPQLVNVLRGEMSLVGPRPERPFFVSTFAQELPNYMRRHSVLPGITGWAQINGLRGDTSLARRLEYDLDYIARWSVSFNIRILLLTPWRLIFERNAY